MFSLLLVCLSVNKIIQKVVGRFSWDFLGGVQAITFWDRSRYRFECRIHFPLFNMERGHFCHRTIGLLLNKLWIDFNEIFRTGRSQKKEQLTTFCDWSVSRSGSKISFSTLPAFSTLNRIIFKNVDEYSWFFRGREFIQVRQWRI